MSGLQLTVDGAPMDLSQTITYKGMMSERCTEPYFRLRLHQSDLFQIRVHPRESAANSFDFNSGYLLRALHTLPRQGSKTPWRVHQIYVKDLSMLRFGRVDDGTMEFKAAR
jgi:hypothetical protein